MCTHKICFALLTWHNSHVTQAVSFRQSGLTEANGVLLDLHACSTVDTIRHLPWGHGKWMSEDMTHVKVFGNNLLLMLREEGMSLIVYCDNWCFRQELFIMNVKMDRINLIVRGLCYHSCPM